MPDTHVNGNDIAGTQFSVDEPCSIRLLSKLNIKGDAMAQQTEHDLTTYSEKLEQIRGYL